MIEIVPNESQIQLHPAERASCTIWEKELFPAERVSNTNIKEGKLLFRDIIK